MFSIIEENSETFKDENFESCRENLQEKSEEDCSSLQEDCSNSQTDCSSLDADEDELYCNKLEPDELNEFEAEEDKWLEPFLDESESENSCRIPESSRDRVKKYDDENIKQLKQYKMYADRHKKAQGLSTKEKQHRQKFVYCTLKHFLYLNLFLY